MREASASRRRNQNPGLRLSIGQLAGESNSMAVNALNTDFLVFVWRDMERGTGESAIVVPGYSPTAGQKGRTRPVLIFLQFAAQFYVTLPARIAMPHEN